MRMDTQNLGLNDHFYYGLGLINKLTLAQKNTDDHAELNKIENLKIQAVRYMDSTDCKIAVKKGEPSILKDKLQHLSMERSKLENECRKFIQQEPTKKSLDFNTTDTLL